MSQNQNQSSRRLAGVRVRGKITLDLDYETKPGEYPLNPLIESLRERLSNQSVDQTRQQKGQIQSPHYHPNPNGSFPVSDGLISYPQP